MLYCTYNLLNMFRVLICPSSGARDYTCVIALIICSTCFEHLYAHHQELEIILVILLHMVCNALAAGGRLLQAEQQAMRQG